MQKSMILELIKNGANYADRQQLFGIKEYWESSTDFNIIIDELCKDLSDDEKRKTLSKIFDALAGMEIVATDEFFKKGFKLGLKLGAQNLLD